jgi:hypothetical protein
LIDESNMPNAVPETLEPSGSTGYENETASYIYDTQPESQSLLGKKQFFCFAFGRKIHKIVGFKVFTINFS